MIDEWEETQVEGEGVASPNILGKDLLDFERIIPYGFVVAVTEIVSEVVGGRVGVTVGGSSCRENA
jgi:hypothetical protein